MMMCKDNELKWIAYVCDNCNAFWKSNCEDDECWQCESKNIRQKGELPKRVIEV